MSFKKALSGVLRVVKQQPENTHAFKRVRTEKVETRAGRAPDVD
jgi:hypothetical protein